MLAPFSFRVEPLAGAIEYIGFSIATGSGEYVSVTSSVQTTAINEPRVMPTHDTTDQTHILYRWQHSTGPTSEIGSFVIDDQGSWVSNYAPSTEIYGSTVSRSPLMVPLTSASSYVAIYRRTNFNNDSVGKVVQYDGSGGWVIGSELTIDTAGANQIPNDAIPISSNRFAMAMIYGAASGYHRIGVYDITGGGSGVTTVDAQHSIENTTNQQHNMKLVVTGSNFAGFSISGTRATSGGFASSYLRVGTFRNLDSTPVLPTSRTTIYDAGGKYIMGETAVHITSTYSACMWYEYTSGTNRMHLSTLTHSGGISRSGSIESETLGASSAAPYSCEMQVVKTEGDLVYFFAQVGGLYMALCSMDTTNGNIKIVEGKKDYGVYTATATYDAGMMFATTGSEHTKFGALLLNENTNNFDYITGSLLT